MQARELRQKRQAERHRERAERTAAGRDRGGLRRWRRVRRRIGDAALRTLGPLLVRMLSLTWRIERRGERGLEVLRGDGPWVLMLWHGRLLVGLQLSDHAHRGIGSLVSPSDDGKLAGVALRRFGYRVIRGSTSRGAARAMREMGEAIASGTPVVVTPDGPRGPRHAMNSGATWLARASGAPLLTFAVAVDRAWRLRSWDRFTIPKPFAKIILTYGDPVTVANDADDLEVERIAEAAAARLIEDERAGFAALGVRDDH
ncbi:MAG: lysophospholipid acyltransferase family protein [Planctomycetes bacterium]|nr:lysophospholipid acyltransferase family protein [Planctomycetota bacterium]